MRRGAAFPIGAGVAMGAAIGVWAVLLIVARSSGAAFLTIEEELGLGFVLGPPWLGAAVAAGSVLVAGFVGGALAESDARLVGACVRGVLAVDAAFVAWVVVWTDLRTGFSVFAVPFLPVHAALLALAGLVVPTVVLFLPAGVGWAAIVSATRSRLASAP